MPAEYEEDRVPVGTSTDPGTSFMDQKQDAELGTSNAEPAPEREEKQVSDQNVSVDQSAAEILDPVDVEPKQVESDTIVFVPFEDFEARINQDTFYFRKDIPTTVTRDQANVYLDAKKGYTKD